VIITSRYGCNGMMHRAGGFHACVHGATGGLVGCCTSWAPPGSEEQHAVVSSIDDHLSHEDLPRGTRQGWLEAIVFGRFEEGPR
jgi:hypothetical protein